MKTLPKELEASLRQKLYDAAVVAVQHDVPVMALEELLREEMVAAASLFPAAKLANGKVSKSRLSALTGLSRKEVMRLIDTPGRKRTMSRAQEVIRAWKRQTRATQISREKFDRLAQSHSRDVPAGAILRVMQWHGYATVFDDRVRLMK